jgi:hypothetical protein
MNRRDRSNKPRLWQLEEAEAALSVAFNPKQNGSRRIASRLFILVRHASGLARHHATDPKVADGLHCTITGESDAAVHICMGQRDSNVCKKMILAVEQTPAPLVVWSKAETLMKTVGR